MRSWPTYLALGIGTLGIAAGLYVFYTTNFNSAASIRASGLSSTFVLGGAIVLAAGLHSLQATFDSWCGGACADGCGCCGDDCSCGDCACCKGEGHAGHSHADAREEAPAS